MAKDKVLKARIKVLYKTWDEWEEEAEFIPLRGELCIVEVPAESHKVLTEPAVLAKVGDGENTFKNLPWLQAVASDVHEWAKKEALEWEDLSEEFQESLITYITSSENSFEIAVKEEAENGFAKSYYLKDANGVQHGETINIPKDYLLKDASVKQVSAENDPYDEAEVGDWYIDFEVNVEDDSAEAKHIYVPLKYLSVNNYSGSGAIDIDNFIITLKIDEENANGLTIGENGLGLALATSGSAGAMSAQDKQAIDNMAIVYEQKRIEITKLPKGSTYKDMGDEVRILVPKDATFTDQPVGEGGDKNSYYATVKMFAPYNAAHYHEFDFNNNEWEKELQDVKIDEYGRKFDYSWLPLAHKETNGSWTNYALSSTQTKFVGWYLGAKWYDEDYNLIGQTKFKVTLATEDNYDVTVSSEVLKAITEATPENLADIAYTGNVNDLIQDEGDYLIIDGNVEVES